MDQRGDNNPQQFPDQNYQLQSDDQIGGNYQLWEYDETISQQGQVEEWQPQQNLGDGYQHYHDAHQGPNMPYDNSVQSYYPGVGSLRVQQSQFHPVLSQLANLQPTQYYDPAQQPYQIFQNVSEMDANHVSNVVPEEREQIEVPLVETVQASGPQQSLEPGMSDAEKNPLPGPSSETNKACGEKNPIPGPSSARNNDHANSSEDEETVGLGQGEREHNEVTPQETAEESGSQQSSELVQTSAEKNPIPGPSSEGSKGRNLKRSNDRAEETNGAKQKKKSTSTESDSDIIKYRSSASGICGECPERDSHGPSSEGKKGRNLKQNKKRNEGKKVQSSSSVTEMDSKKIRIKDKGGECGECNKRFGDIIGHSKHKYSRKLKSSESWNEESERNEHLIQDSGTQRIGDEDYPTPGPSSQAKNGPDLKENSDRRMADFQELESQRKSSAPSKTGSNGIKNQYKRGKCCECNKVYLAISHHSRDKHNGKLEKCTATDRVCKEYFASAQKRVEHEQQEHLERKEFQCQFCHYSAGLKTDLKRHVLTMHSEKNIKCGQQKCGKMFASEADLKRHVKMYHTVEKCPKCGRDMSRYALVQHKRRIVECA
ncbi:zinc finger protein 436-like [Cloeon dipterum]|uniref:zinc finger protein 436-like n=1 Tax=Cloeon dipterum TaxID=197152 RepID=UPI00321FA0FA